MHPIFSEKRLIILDRDGVINVESPHYIKGIEEWHPIPKSLEAIALLTQAGFRIAIATNQSGVGRELYSLDTLHAIHEHMRLKLKPLGGNIDVIFYCTHLPEEMCKCRKPKTGMLEAIAAHFHITLENVPFIGDSWRDWVAAEQMGARPLLVKTGLGLLTLENHAAEIDHQFVFSDLWHATQFLLGASP